MSKEFEDWKRCLIAVGGGLRLMYMGGAAASFISPWHEGCPNVCLPCNCSDEDRRLAAGLSEAGGGQ